MASPDRPPLRVAPELDDADDEALPTTERTTTAPSVLGRLNQHGFRLIMVLDAFAVMAASVGVMVARFGFAWPDYPVGLYFVSFAVTTCIFVLSFYLGGLYEREPRLGAPPVLPRAAPQALVAGGAVALLTLALTGLARELGLTTERALPFPILNLAIVIGLASAAVAVNRALANVARTSREGFPRVLLVGAADEREAAVGNFALEGTRAIVVAETDDPDAVVDVVANAAVTDVLLLSRDWLDRIYPDGIRDLELAGVTVLVRVTAKETLLGVDRVREVGGLPFVLVRPHAIPQSRARFKRLFDDVVLLLAAVVWVPVLAFMAVYQGLAAGRPLLYWQERVGRNGETFWMVKFRTMRTDAEDDGHGPRLATPDDPRIIPACRWVRATRMDELPQLYNVVRGEMSLVGPRPERPELVEALAARIPGYERRHEVPPGMTGLAQIYGRYHTDAEYKLGYDLQYLVNWSPVLDLEILFKTVWVVLARRL
ncbi:MAG: exopolysaccharide biosynthesis polyprenyl glycosylphosphotransferase [Nitriliruptoraceae bacterium]